MQPIPLSPPPSSLSPILLCLSLLSFVLQSESLFSPASRVTRVLSRAGAIDSLVLIIDTGLWYIIIHLNRNWLAPPAALTSARPWSCLAGVNESGFTSTREYMIKTVNGLYLYGAFLFLMTNQSVSHFSFTIHPFTHMDLCAALSHTHHSHAVGTAIRGHLESSILPKGTLAHGFKGFARNLCVGCWWQMNGEVEGDVCCLLGCCGRTYWRPLEVEEDSVWGFKSRHDLNRDNYRPPEDTLKETHAPNWI